MSIPPNKRCNKVAWRCSRDKTAVCASNRETRLYQSVSIPAAVLAMRVFSNTVASGWMNWLNNAAKKHAAPRRRSSPARTPRRGARAIGGHHSAGLTQQDSNTEVKQKSSANELDGSKPIGLLDQQYAQAIGHQQRPQQDAHPVSHGTHDAISRTTTQSVPCHDCQTGPGRHCAQ